MNFGNLEKIEELILRPAKNFIIKNTVVLGRRNSKNGFRIDCFKENVYKSNKYDNYKYLGSLYMESSDFLVFNCKNDENNSSVEIYSSYQHIQKIRNGFNTMLEHLDEAFYEDKEEGIITLKPEYETFVVDINGLVNNHSIKMIYNVNYDEDAVSHKYEKAVTIVFNDEAFYTTITDENLQGITYFLNNFNLLSSSQHLKQMAYMQQIAYALELENQEMLPTEYTTGSGGKLNSKPKRNFKRINRNNEEENDEE